MPIVTTFNKGMYQDSLLSEQPPGTYRDAENVVTSSNTASGFGIANEQYRKLVGLLPGKIVGKSVIESRNQTLIFVLPDEIWLFDNKTFETTFVCKGSEFGCSWSFSSCEYLYAEFKKFNKCRELHAYWSNNCIYHVVNIDEMLNPVRKESVKELEDPCGHFDLMKVTCGPLISGIASKNNGTAVESGSYACAVRLSDTDGNDTNVFEISRFIAVGSDDNTVGQVGHSSIKFNITSLDKRYNKAIIYIVKESAGITTVYKMDSRTYNSTGFTFEYYGQKGELVHSSELIVREKAWLLGMDLFQKDNRLHLYGIKKEKNLNYQKYANHIQPSYVEYETSLEQVAKYHYPSLMRGEVYALGIVWKYADGTYSPAFHIPGGGASAASVGLEVRAQVSTGGGYAPIELSDFNSKDEFLRKRDPSELKDRLNESDKLEDQVKTDITNIDTNYDNTIGAADCHDNLYGCSEAGDAFQKDIRDVGDIVESSTELLAGMGKDDPDPDVNTTTSIKDAALKLYNDALKNREYITRKKPVLTYTGAGGVVASSLEFRTAEASSGRSDNWVDSEGVNQTDDAPKELSSGAMEVYTSTVLYPKDKDCDGQHFYPQGPITHPKIPHTSKLPHFVSYANGVENQYQVYNDPYGKTSIRFIGLKLDGIHMPSAEELPKPLCPFSPYKIVYVKRTDQNKSIFAKGWLSGIFTGQCHGVQNAFPRLGTNSFEHVDVSIAAGDGSSHMGEQSNAPIYTFHSPDTDSNKSFLPVNKIRQELKLKGSGWKYGLFTEGQKPDDRWNGMQKDNLGCRIGNNLNHYDVGGTEADILGITEAPAMSAPSPVGGMTIPLNNMYRESSTWLETSANMPGDELDESFVGGVMNHFGPTKCNAPYVTIYRELPDQYGSVEGLQYADLGLNARGDQTSIKGICGDTYVGPYSKKRTAFVSNKKGDLFNPPAKPGSPCRPRRWCDMPDDKIFEYTGIDYYPTKLPQSGDLWDPKNYAGLHTIAGGCGDMGLSRTDKDAAGVHKSESDLFWPQTLKGVVHTIVECEVNPYLRETGEGPQKETGLVHYGHLKDLHLDANAPTAQPWEGSWLGRFFTPIYQPSAKQMAMKATIRSLLTVGGPAAALYNLQHLNEIMGLVMGMMTASGLSAIWATATNTLFGDRKLNDLLHIGACRKDEEGGDLDGLTEGFEDNYTRYNKDHQRVNDIYPYTAFPLPYNTCDCSECIKENTTEEIFYSNPQNYDSEIDAYKNFKINNYQNELGQYGKLERLFVVNGEMYAHLSNGVALIKLNPATISSDVVLQQVGDGNLLGEPQLVTPKLGEGFGGTRHPNAAILTPLGYITVDDEAKKIYIFNGQFEEITRYGLYNFFQNKLGFCNESECYDEKQGHHYSLAWDPRYNRLLVTKVDGGQSFTASFEPAGQGSHWVSRHTYTPSDYFWNRRDLFSIENDSIYIHNQPGGFLPMMVEAVATDGEVFEFAGLKMDTHAVDSNLRDIDTTFETIAAYNSTQGTGTRSTKLISDNKGAVKDQTTRSEEGTEIKVTKNARRWDINDIADLVKEDCGNQPMTTQGLCDPRSEINEGVFDCDVQKQQKRRPGIQDDHLVYRMTFAGKMQLYLKKLITKKKGEA
jgi:hypothetical protein